jgi:hypothetical protein
MANIKLVDIEVRLVHETDKAYLVRGEDRKIEVWLPKSRCELGPLNRTTGNREVTLEESLAIDKRLV